MPKGKSLSVDMRKLIIDKFQSGERQSDIAKQLNLNRSVISKTISLYNQRRSLVNVPKSGKPRKTTRITDRKIGMLSKQNPFWDAVKIKKKIPNVSLSVRSISRPLNEIGLYGRKPAKKSFISVKNRRARIQFAKEHLN
jgi:transposase